MLESEVTANGQTFVNRYRQSGTVRRADRKFIVQILIECTHSQDRIKQLVLETHSYVGGRDVTALYQHLYTCIGIRVHEAEL